ncbi:MAG: DUF89 family protein [Oscillospiraceae bacterium]|nr:DUF89 family protein [Oscillospiraceae bacterium]
MSISMNSTCLECFLSKRLEQVRALGTDEQSTEMAKKLAMLYAQSDADMDSAVLGGLAEDLINEYYSIDPDRMREEKEMSNRFVLERLDKVRSRIAAAEDPIYAALQYAVLGNYLDFSALYGQVSFEDMDKMLDTAFTIDLDKACYAQFLKDLKNGKRFLYLTDNAGEICFDRVLAEIIAEAFPQLEITFCVRGKPIVNDATREDAEIAGIRFPIIDNGIGIGGTPIHMIGAEAKAALDAADVILAKGMGNTESMFGCGYNIYYAFLVKCERFMEFFQAPKMKPLFIRDHT